MEGIAGADPTDHRAAAAGLPPIDSISHWDYLVTGKSKVSPRTAIPLGSCSAAPDEDAFCQTEGYQQTTVNAVVSYLGEGEERQLYKLLVGRVPLAGWTWAKYPGPPPNGTSNHGTPTLSCGTPGVNGSGCLYNLDADPYERDNLACVHHTTPHHTTRRAEPDRPSWRQRQLAGPASTTYLPTCAA